MRSSFKGFLSLSNGVTSLVFAPLWPVKSGVKILSGSIGIIVKSPIFGSHSGVQAFSSGVESGLSSIFLERIFLVVQK